MLKDKILSASGGGVDPIYVDDVFSTWLYTGTGSSQTINNGIDLAGKGGLVWLKSRSGGGNHRLVDTARGFVSPGGFAFMLSTSNANGQATLAAFDSFNSNGFSISETDPTVNASGITYASWTFREAEKFFDVVTWTGNGSNRTIAHNLGSVPGCIIVKRTDTASDWQVYHRSLANTQYMVLNTTAAVATGATRWNSTTPTSTVFSLGTDATVNANGGTYVAYLFAHDAGGFGATGNDNVISCGSYTGNGSATGPTVTLGYEPQWLLVKRSSSGTGNWVLLDTMRGFSLSTENELYANLNLAEGSGLDLAEPNATGFQIKTSTGDFNASGVTYIYIAIRRPHKPPTSGTSVFYPLARTGTGTATNITGAGFPPDLFISANRNTTINRSAHDRLRGIGLLVTNLTNAEDAGYTNSLTGFGMDGISVGADTSAQTINVSGNTYANYFFRRAPGFFDVVCYTGTGNGQVINHNLGAVPELAIFKLRAGTGGADWVVRAPGTTTDRFLLLNSTNAQSTAANWYSATSTQITFPTAYAGTASSGFTYVVYLFASLPGISQVGSYTGNGSSQTINCGFSAGARFVLIRRTDSTGNWVTFDTARGIVSGNDPALYLNSNAAEVTGVDGIDPDSSGFIVNQESTFNLNVNGASYIYLSVA